MEDGDPLVALQACIAAVRRGGVGEGGSTSSVELERSLRRVGEALGDKDREIEWLREALEQSRESYEESSRALEQLAVDHSGVGVVSGGAPNSDTVGGVVGVVGVATVSGVEEDTRGLELERGNDRMRESAYESDGVLVSEEAERQLQSTVDGS